MYNLLVALGALLYVVMLTIACKKNTSWKKGLPLSIISLFIQLSISKGLLWVTTGSPGPGMGYYIRIWAFMPLVYWGLAKLFKIDYVKLLDLQAIPNLAGNSLAKIACVYEGCCQGFSYYEGSLMYKISRILTGTDTFPIQLVEVIVGFAIAIGLWVYRMRKKEEANGKIFVYWFVLFGGTRFLLEFLRDNKKIVQFASLRQADGYFGISELAVWALLMVAIGLMVYWNISHKEKEKSVKVLN